MGKRKKVRRKIIKARPLELVSIFDCPFCYHKKTVSVKKDRAKQIASVSCQLCGVAYKTKYNNLTDPIDVYSEWIDACHAVNQGA